MTTLFGIPAWRSLSLGGWGRRYPNGFAELEAAALVATWEDVGEELAADVQLALTPAQGAESQTGQTASLFEEPSFSQHERKIYGVLKAGEILAALFELELAGTVKQLP